MLCAVEEAADQSEVEPGSRDVTNIKYVGETQRDLESLVRGEKEDEFISRAGEYKKQVFNKDLTDQETQAWKKHYNNLVKTNNRMSSTKINFWLRDFAR